MTRSVRTRHPAGPGSEAAADAQLLAVGDTSRGSGLGPQETVEACRGKSSPTPAMAPAEGRGCCRCNPGGLKGTPGWPCRARRSHHPLPAPTHSPAGGHPLPVWLRTPWALASAPRSTDAASLAPPRPSRPCAAPSRAWHGRRGSRGRGAAPAERTLAAELRTGPAVPELRGFRARLWSARSVLSFERGPVSSTSVPASV